MLRFYNTLTRQKDVFQPLKPGQVSLYTCGPTVYNHPHIGNYRAYIFEDLLRRYLKYRGYNVTQVMNLTDVEDKIIRDSQKAGLPLRDFTAIYTRTFFEDLRMLHIEPAEVYPAATDHIPEMVALIKKLQERGYTYTVDGSIYYRIDRFSAYGKLAHLDAEALQSGASGRVDSDEYAKDDVRDFALWKAWTPEDGDVYWETELGKGRPGWHIECSAMSMKYLGPHFDMHTGGEDNIFPHHEDEIAQSEGFTGEAFVNYWVHAQHLLADGQKMAKSTGNAYTCSEIEGRGFDPMALRYFYTTALYRSRVNFTFRALQAAQTSLERLRELAYQLFTQADEALVFSDEPLGPTHWRDAFLAEVEHDLNIPRAMAVVWAMLRSHEDDPVTRSRLLLEFDRILGFDLKNYLQSDQPREKWDPRVHLAAVPGEVAAQVLEREELRHHTDYSHADQLRHSLNAAGYTIRDTRQGPLVLPRNLEEEFTVLSSSSDAPDFNQSPDLFEFSVNLLAHNSRDDLERCIASICRHSDHRDIELVIIDNGSTAEPLPYLQQLARHDDLPGEHGRRVTLQVLFADHNMGFAAGRNATMRASRGRFIVLMDTSIEVTGDIWEPLAAALADRNMGVVGPYGLVTEDLREFHEAPGPDVDAIEGYLMAFRRSLLPEVGWIDERFRFYRLMDIHYSFFFKTSGYRVLTTPLVAEQIEKHPHREWESLSEDERATKSKKNYDIFRARWHHGESLLVANYNPQHLWRGHDHHHHLEGTHTHEVDELPPLGVMHTHIHQHWPDHSHEHAHYHELRHEQHAASSEE